ncbi:MAG: DUF1257 domain-containing protein [Pirellulales bacterium]
MSHLVTIKTKVHDRNAVAAACQRQGISAPVEGTANLYSGHATGLLITLPGWHYPAVIDTVSGEVRFDNFGGRWGEQKHLDQFLQFYAVEKAKLEARKQGHAVSEEVVSDGSIRVKIVVGN